MIRVSRRGMTVVLLAVSALAVGCTDKKEQQIAYLTQQNIDLSKKNKELHGELASARTRESQLMSQMESKDLRVTALQAENQDLKKKLAAAGAGPTTPPAPGAETTVYRQTVGSDVLFPAGKATLSSSGRSRLNEIVSLLRSRYAGAVVRVYGYTDSDPIRKTRKLWKDNLDLSANRAMAVTRYLRSRGIPAEKVETVAMGATNFVASNNTSTGKAKNRRVEIVVVKS